MTVVPGLKHCIFMFSSPLGRAFIISINSIMSVSDLKSQIINRIAVIEDELILNQISKLISLENEIESVYQLTDEERVEIEIGLNDVREGRVYSSEDADRMINQWLKK